MKKILLLTVSILMVTVVFGRTTNPIPSYNVFVTGQALFVDNGSGAGTVGDQKLSAEKRDMNVENGAGGTNSPSDLSSIIVIIYRLDRSIVLGPYLVPAGQNLSVPIDDSPWAVSVVAGSGDYVSVWTDNGN
jgi:hypothetical protein